MLYAFGVFFELIFCLDAKFFPLDHYSHTGRFFYLSPFLPFFCLATPPSLPGRGDCQKLDLPCLCWNGTYHLIDLNKSDWGCVFSLLGALTSPNQWIHWVFGDFWPSTRAEARNFYHLTESESVRVEMEKVVRIFDILKGNTMYKPCRIMDDGVWAPGMFLSAGTRPGKRWGYPLSQPPWVLTGGGGGSTSPSSPPSYSIS